MNDVLLFEDTERCFIKDIAKKGGMRYTYGEVIYEGERLMEQKNCYLKVTGITESQMQEFKRKKLDLDELGIEISAKILNYLEYNRGIKLYSKEEEALMWSILETFPQEERIEVPLQMLELSISEAQEDIKYLRSEGIIATIQYHESEVTTMESNDDAFNISTFNNNTSNITANEITSDNGKMKQYLNDIYTLEKELFASKRGLEEVEHIIENLGKSKNLKVEGVDRSIISNVFWRIVWTIVGVIVGIIGGSVVLLPIVGNMDMGSPIFLIIILALAIIGGYYGYSHGDVATRHDSIKYRESLRAIKDDELRVEKELATMPAYKEKEKLLHNNIAMCKKTLNQLYSLNIIFPKYRNLIAISQIYEYFVSGRCTTLEGHEGAYNIFENELRQNIIILQLNIVINQLEQIKQNQYMVYQAIQNSNQLLASIERNMSIAAYNTSVIAENTAISNRYH